MSLSKAICPKCGAEILVNAADEATICELCGAPLVTAKAIDAFSQKETITDKSADTFPHSYTVTIRRERDPRIRNAITFLLILNDRPRPLSDDAVISFKSDEKHVEIPVFITDNAKNSFEGLLTFTSDGKNVDIVWAASREHKTLGVIRSTTNSTVMFEERPGAADNWGHGQV